MHRACWARCGSRACPERSEGDEARVGQQGTVTRVWALRGTRPRAPRDQRRTSAYLFGAVCPLRGTTAGLVMSRGNARTLSDHLAAISAEVASGSHAVLVRGGAGYPVAKDLVVPKNILLLFLPPYAPELEPHGERVGLSSGQQTRQQGLSRRRAHRRCLLRRLEFLCR